MKLKQQLACSVKTPLCKITKVNILRKKKKKLAKTKEFMEDNDENVEKREVDVVNVNRSWGLKCSKRSPNVWRMKKLKP